MLTITQDSREKDPLYFPELVGMSVSVGFLDFGDYGARYNDSVIKTVFERKSLGDLFNSYTSNYEAEKAKFLRAHESGFRFILAIEEPFSEVLKGHTYRKNGELVESKKSGISMIRQLMTITNKYGVEVHYFQSRREMALYIQEYFLAFKRISDAK